jgi:tetratricopeptide (TPR) repeat protein
MRTPGKRSFACNLVMGMILRKRLLLVPVVLLFCGPVAFSQTQSAQVEAITSALRAREFDRAVRLSRSALQKFPNDAQLWTLQGVALAGEGDPKKALAAFQQALKISPNYIAAIEGAAQIEYQMGNRDAVPLLSHLLQLRPGDPTGHAMLAVLEYRQGNCAAAVGHFERAGELLDSQLDGLHAYATCLVRLKQLDGAAKVFERAVALYPNEPRERLVLASLQLMAHNPQEAIATLGPLLEANANAETLQLASAAYEDAKDTPHAVSSLRQAILLDPRNIDLYLDFANISFAHDSFQVGIDVINEGIGLEPNAAPLYLARGVLYVQLSEYDKAEADFERAQELDPNESLSVAAQGLAAVQANDLDHALSTVQTKLARNPNDALLLYLQADILAQKGAAPGAPEFQLAMRSAKRAVALRPTLAAARGVLAKLYMETGQYPEAAEQCREALKSDPKDQTALYRLIQALRKTGNKSEIPDLLKRLALLREQATEEDRERYRYKLIETDTQPQQP